MKLTSLALAGALFFLLACAPPAPVNSSALSGKIIEILQSGAHTFVHLNTSRLVQSADTGGYSHIRYDSRGMRVWVMVPQIPQIRMEVGQDVTFRPGEFKRNFMLTAMGRAFDLIYVSEGLVR